VGFYALSSNTTGSRNDASGNSALFANTTGNENTAIGDGSLYSSATGSDNIALGYSAGYNLTSGSYNIYVGNQGAATESNTIRIGKAGTQTATFIAGISGATAASGVAVYVNADGQLGTLNSSSRFKKDIADMSASSEAILSLRPVTFRYKPEVACDTIRQFGLIAEEVEKICPELVARDAKGNIYTVRYDAVNTMLLNEFLKEHKRVGEQACENEKQNAKIHEQERELSEQQTEIEGLRQEVAEMRRVVERIAQHIK
jgi:hypothetical protein